jgi:photosystem II stability/assembly factor-like uncharacterized protein
MGMLRSLITWICVIPFFSLPISGCGAGKVGTGAPSDTRTASPAGWWQLESAGGLAQITAVTCPDEQFCLVVDHNGFAMSGDGGVTWRHATFAPSPMAFMGAAISCPSPKRCVAVGIAGPGATPAVALTTDGAATWQIQMLAGAGSALTTVTCPTESVCLSAGSVYDEFRRGVIYLSHDGGAHWSPVSVGWLVEVSAIACSSSLRCVADGTTIQNGTLGPATILRTVDGGQHWTSTILVQPASLGQLACVASGRCLAVGFSTHDVFTAEPVILVQDDATHSFMRSVASLEVTRLEGISCATPIFCVAVGVGTPDISSPSGGRPGVVVVTADGGKSWHREPIPSDASDVLAVSCRPTLRCLAGAMAGSAPYRYLVLSRTPSS